MDVVVTDESPPTTEMLVSDVQFKEFICGWTAAFINITVTYPLNKVIFRQMLEGLNARSAARQIYYEGAQMLYRGMLPPLCQKTLSVSIMFGVYEECRRPLTEFGVAPNAAKVIAGLFAGSVEAILMPFERVQTLLSDERYHTKFRNTAHVMRVIGLQYGVREYYRGLVPILLRNGPSNVMFFMLRDAVTDHIPAGSSAVNAFTCEFVGGALIGMMLSALFYPLNVVKVNAQSTLGGEFKNVFSIVHSIISQRGFKVRNLYRGVTTNCTRAFFSWGIMNAAYSWLKDLIN